MAPQTQSLGASSQCVLLTRPQRDSERIAPDFKELGYEVIISPVLGIKHFDIIVPPYDLICLSSKNALPVLQNIPKNTPLFCVGSYTKQLIQDMGFSTITMAPTAKDLYALLKAQPGKILYLSGAITTLDFSEHLKNCTKVICYEATPLKSFSVDVFKKSITHIPLYSARSAELLHKLLRKNKINLRGITILALSIEIANIVKDFDFKEILTSANPTHQSLLTLLTRK